MVMKMGNVRLLPALLATGGVVFALKAATLAEAAAEAVEAAPAAKAEAPPDPAKAGGADKSCTIPSFAEQAGLSATEVEVLQSLGARRTALDQRETDLSTQAQLVEASQKRADERLAEMKRVQAQLELLVNKVNEEQNARMAGLVVVYSKMKPKDAAKIFEGLDNDVLLDVATRMKQTVLAPIMGSMSPEAARKLTKAIAEQKKAPEDLLTKATTPPGAKAGGKPG
jgi:flagellar motility protein MotE (MotC chaperone)